MHIWEEQGTGSRLSSLPTFENSSSRRPTLCNAPSDSDNHGSIHVALLLVAQQCIHRNVSQNSCNSLWSALQLFNPGLRDWTLSKARRCRQLPGILCLLPSCWQSRTCKFNWLKRPNQANSSACHWITLQESLLISMCYKLDNLRDER